MTDRADRFRHNHYVPEWYQRRFLLPGTSKYHYLDLTPEVRRSGSHVWIREALRHLGPSNCFAQDDLYTTGRDGILNVDIEKFFFGTLDNDGKASVEYFSEYNHKNIDNESFRNFLRYISVQKLRTPKGLAWLEAAVQSKNRGYTLQQLQRAQNIFCAAWTDCIWQIANAGKSATKFIVSDHPVTVYNRDMFPGSSACRFPNDPDIRQVGTHTIFPLDLNKILILTNLAWVRNPYQRAEKIGPNEKLFRQTIFNFTEIQTGRELSEEEVWEINYIIKRRAKRYVAAAEKDWLTPELRLRTDHWRRFGDGYLLMPDPRHVHMGGTTYIGYGGGHSEAFGPYGHRPWERAFEDERRERIESEALIRFQAEWSAKFGPIYRGNTPGLGGSKSNEMPAGYYQVQLERDQKELRRPGERARRRKLQR